MPKFTEFVALSGSERTVMSGAKPVGSADPSEQLQVTVLLRSKANPDERENAMKALASQPPAKRKHLTRQEFAAARGAQQADIEQVQEFARQYGLTVVRADAARRAVVLGGTVAAFNKAFQVNLSRYEHPNGSYRGRTGPIHIPKELSGVITAVMGLDNRPQATPHFRLKKKPKPKTGPAGTFTPPQVASLYTYPAAATGNGQCIALIELGGGYKQADLTNYFTNTLKITLPTVISISVDNAQNSPAGSANSADGEVVLDIEVAGGVAPQAKIAVYFAPNTDQGFYDAISQAVHDTTNNPSVISISWGGPESSWTQQSLTEFNTLLEDASTLGVTVCVAAGDSGSTDGVTDGLQHADFPASSPYVLACGGTKLTGTGSNISTEVVWNETSKNEGATGGGVSAAFAKPEYQASANVPPSVNPGNFIGRGLPDVAGNADPTTGYDIYVDGQATVVGGTSAVAPLLAGLIARVNQTLGKPVGFINPTLYAQAISARVCHDVTSGNNGAYSAGPGWDACTGWGSPDGSAIAALLTGAPAATKNPTKVKTKGKAHTTVSARR